MKVYRTDEIRNVVLLGHGGSGKTSLAEAMAYVSGATNRMGKITDGNTISDFDKEEQKREFSISTSLIPIEWEKAKINILDTPGHQDFAEDTYRTLTAVDSVIIVVDGAKGVETQTRKLMEVCRMRKTPVIIFVNKMDREGKDPFDLLDELEEELMIQVRPLSWPIEQGARIKGVYNIYEQKLDLYQPSKQMVTEKVAVDIHSEELDQQNGKS